MMFWQRKRTTRRHVNPNRSQLQRRQLLLEGLEQRAMMTGTVNIVIFPNAAPGTLTLVGDGSNNQVEIRQTANVNEFFISSPDSTRFQVNGAGVTFDQFTVNNIFGDIAVSLGDGNDTFLFSGVAPEVPSVLPEDLLIFNADGSDVNTLDTVHIINGDFLVEKDAASSGYSELHILRSLVIGSTHVDNVGNGTGDTKTVIDASILEGIGSLDDNGEGEGEGQALIPMLLPSPFALLIENPHGDQIVDILGNSQFGTGSFIAGQPIVEITNLGGGSRTTLTGASDIAGPRTTTIYGDLRIANGPALAGFLNIVTMNSVNVLGRVDVTNGGSSTETVVAGATLGSHATFGLGGPFTLRNNAGFDTFTMTDSAVPWGLLIDNDVAAGGSSNWGSETDVANSDLGGLLNPIADNALRVLGDNLADTFTLRDSTLFAVLDLQFRGGLNRVLLQNNPATISAFNYIGGSGNDTVTIDNTRILLWINIQLLAGADTLRIVNENYATQWPSPLFESIVIDAGLGLAGGVDTFIGTLPPNDVFQGFDLFLP